MTGNIAIGLAALGAAIGVGLMTSKFMESAARQPELMGKLFTNALVLAGLIDAIFIITVGISFVL